MAKISEFTNVSTPIGSGSILSPKTWVSMIMAVIAMIIAVAVGQNLASKVGATTGVDTKIESLTATPNAGRSVVSIGA